ARPRTVRRRTRHVSRSWAMKRLHLALARMASRAAARPRAAGRCAHGVIGSHAMTWLRRALARMAARPAARPRAVGRSALPRRAGGASGMAAAGGVGSAAARRLLAVVGSAICIGVCADVGVRVAAQSGNVYRPKLAVSDAIEPFLKYLEPGS